MMARLILALVNAGLAMFSAQGRESLPKNLSGQDSFAGRLNMAIGAGLIGGKRRRARQLARIIHEGIDKWRS
jgi:hypothetical protein